MFGLKKIKAKNIFPFLGNFGIDPAALIEKQMPGLLAKARDFQQQAGARVLQTLQLSEDESHFILALYKQDENGDFQLWQEYPLQDLKFIIEKVKTSLENDDSEINLEGDAGTTTGTTTISGNYTGNNNAGTESAAAAVPTEPEPDPYDFTTPGKRFPGWVD